MVLPLKFEVLYLNYYEGLHIDSVSNTEIINAFSKMAGNAEGGNLVQEIPDCRK